MTRLPLLRQKRSRQIQHDSATLYSGGSETESRENIDAVQRMQDYIERSLTEAITLRRIARVAGYSPWYSARIFKRVTGKTPFEYIRARRLSRAAVKLRD